MDQNKQTNQNNDSQTGTKQQDQAEQNQDNPVYHDIEYSEKESGQEQKDQGDQ